MDRTPSELLNVRETAKRLGVHENTVRNWVRQGVLQDARLPGSRFHRFRSEDVDRLLTQRGSSAPTLQTERRNVNPELVGASQLDQWPEARARDAQSNFPELIRRLVGETPGASIVTLRSGDGVALTGLDGVVEVEAATAYLPAGRLLFELGVSANPGAKATSDYDKRALDAPADCVFVFATPRRWPGAAKWADNQRARGHFRDVRAIDADVLEGWLEQAPSAHHWISEHLGLRPRDAVSLDTWWHRLSTTTDPILPTRLFIAGRAAEVESLRRHLLEKEPRLTAIECEWASDGLAFVHAVINDDRDALLANVAGALIVQAGDVWDRVVERSGRAILIPQFDGADVDAAINAGHHVVSIIDPTHGRRRTVDVTLPRLGRSEATEAFQQVGVDWQEANRLAGLARRSLPALVRSRSRNPQVKRPSWALPPDSETLATLVLAGAWTDAPGDQNLLCELSGKPWRELESILTRSANGPDPLFRRVGDHWELASPEEAFLLLCGSLTSGAVGRWQKLVPGVLLEADPFHELSDAERIAAQLRGVRRQYSATLRRGVAQGLAMAGTVTDTPNSTVVGPPTASALVRRLLHEAQSDGSGGHWCELSDFLPLLAEASPEEFLIALDEELSRSEPSISHLFLTRTETFSFGPTTRHSGLLWAIETLCWSPEYLIRGAQVLARLCRFELPENIGNRPLGSLSSVLCGWVKNTDADLAVRLDALDAVNRVSAQTGWQLLLALWPTRHGTSFPPARPRFRMLLPASSTVLLTDWMNFVHALVARATDWAEVDQGRLVELIDRLDPLPPADRDKLIAHLESRASDVDADVRLALFERLQGLTASHERFSDADWVLPGDVLERLKTLKDRLEPTEDVRRLAYLFDWHPDLAGLDQSDFEVYRLALEAHRDEVLDEVLGLPEPIPFLAEIARRAKAPGQLGWSLAKHEVDIDIAIAWLTSTEPPLQDAARNWLHRAIVASGGAALADLLSRKDLSTSALNLVVSCVPATKEAWDVLASYPDVENQYWLTAHIEVVDRPHTLEAIEKLMAHGRPWPAIAVASYGIKDGDPDQPSAGLTVRIVIDVLRSAIGAEPGEGEMGQMTGYYIGRLLDYLESAGASETEVAQLEFAYFRLLEHHRRPKALNRVMARDPELFVDFVRRVYRGKNDSPAARVEDEAMATQAIWVLRGWKGFPGRRDDGTLDARVMEDWVRKARLLLSDLDRTDIGDEVIGESFAPSPSGADGVWPAEPIRELIESIGSRELENGLVIGRLNSRGVESRDVYEGGQRERKKAQRYRDWSKLVQGSSPRTARVLRAIAESYDRDAVREDQRAQIDQDRD